MAVRQWPRWAGYSVSMAIVLAGASAAAGQQVPPPEPPETEPTTIVDPVGKPDAPPADNPSPPKHVPPDASGIDLTTLRTRDLDLLYFDPVQTYVTPYVARSFENAMVFHKRMFDWTPWETTTMLIKDFSDYGNAGARASPNNAVLLDIAPLSIAMETFTPGERFFTITNHELAHVATMDVWNSRDAGWRRFFRGKPMPIQEHPESILYNFLTTPRSNAPRWYLEGSAVFFETWMSGGLGRAQGGFDEMVFRAKVRDGERFFSPLGLESEGSAIDYQVGVNDYLYGTRFFSYLALEHGPDKAVEWLRRSEGSKAYYAAQFRNVFGRRLDKAWSDWIDFERGYQRSNLERLAKFPLTETVKLSPRGLGSMSRGFVDERTNSLVAAFRYPGRIGFLGRLDLATGKLTELTEIKGMMLYRVTSLAFDADSRTAYYVEDNYAYRDLMAVDVDSGEKRMLIRDARIGDLAINAADKSIWGVRHENGLATIVRLPPPYQGFNQIHTFAYGQIPFDLDISPDGTRLSASFGEIDGSQSVRIWDLTQMSPDSDPAEVARLNMPPSIPEGFVFAPDGQSLYGTSYYTGVSNVFRFDIASGGFEAVSNASTGFFRPIPQADGTLIAYEYSGEGLQPVRFEPTVHDDLGTIDFLGTRLVNARPELKQWGVGSPARIELEPLIVERSKYNSALRRKLAAAYPIVEGFKGQISPGWYVHLADPLGFNQINASVSLSPFGAMPTGDRIHGKIQFKTLNWDLQYLHNGADFYDLFGPVERGRKGDAFIARYNKTRIYDPPRQLDLHASGALYLGLERLPSAQNVSSPANIASVEAGIKYSNTRKALGAVDHEKGLAWRSTAEMDFDLGTGRVFPKLSGGIDYGFPLPLPNSSVWLYAHAGQSWGPRASPLAAFYFGSFRNNYVDDRSEKRYREAESFPGFEIDEIAARRFGKLTGEINLPPIRFAEIGTPAIYMNYVRPALFAGAMMVDTPGGDTRRYYDLGGQLDFNVNVAHRLPMVFSVGAAAGWAGSDYRKTELLASLKIM